MGMVYGYFQTAREVTRPDYRDCKRKNLIYDNRNQSEITNNITGNEGARDV